MQFSPLIIGHRGASASAPENTIAAFQLALEAGADGVEFDVRLTRDGVPVVIHDDNLKRTGSSPVRVRDLSLSELKRVDVGRWFNPGKFDGEKVPTLEEVFGLFESTNALLYLEMKSDPQERELLAQTCCRLIGNRSVKKRVIVECFDLAAIEIVKNIDADIQTAALFEPRLDILTLRSSQTLAKQAVAAKANQIALHHRLVNEGLVSKARDLGLKIVVWTVDNTTWINRAASLGIHAIITNNPRMMIQARENAVRSN